MILFSRILPAAVLAAVGGSTARASRADEPGQRPEQRAEIVVNGGYSPARIEVREGEPVRLQFLRKDASSCTRVVTFPKLNIQQELREDARTDIVLPPLAAGTFEFRCGMGMVKGTLVVSPR